MSKLNWQTGGQKRHPPPPSEGKGRAPAEGFKTELARQGGMRFPAVPSTKHFRETGEVPDPYIYWSDE